MPTMGLRATPSRTAAARIEPTKGPVQEKETMTIARATKKAATYPPLSASRSALLARPEGHDGEAEDDALEDAGPLGAAAPDEEAHCHGYHGEDAGGDDSGESGEEGYEQEAPEALTGKPTVMGIMGKTQGVMTPASPARKAMSRKLQKP